jgi:cytoskeletal protein RodZ
MRNLAFLIGMTGLVAGLAACSPATGDSGSGIPAEATPAVADSSSPPPSPSPQPSPSPATPSPSPSSVPPSPTTPPPPPAPASAAPVAHSAPPAPAPAPAAWCTATASVYNAERDWNNVYVQSNRPYRSATASADGYSWSYETNGSGYALIYLNGPPAGAEITVTVGGASCTTSD